MWWRRRSHDRHSTLVHSRPTKGLKRLQHLGLAAMLGPASRRMPGSSYGARIAGLGGWQEGSQVLS
jgi:hypothetical protein